jgi:hypothetical protein
MTPAMLRIRIQAVYEGVDLPAGEDDFLKLVVRYRERHAAWRQFTSERSEPLTADRLAKTLEASSVPKYLRARTPHDDGEARKIRRLAGARHAPGTTG